MLPRRVVRSINLSTAPCKLGGKRLSITLGRQEIAASIEHVRCIARVPNALREHLCVLSLSGDVNLVLKVLVVHQVLNVARRVSLVSGVRDLTLREPLLLIVIRQLSPRLISGIPLGPIHAECLLGTVRIEHPRAILVLPSTVHLQILIRLMSTPDVVGSSCACSYGLLIQIRAVVGVRTDTDAIRLLNRTDVREKCNWVLLGLRWVQLGVR